MIITPKPNIFRKHKIRTPINYLKILLLLTTVIFSLNCFSRPIKIGVISDLHFLSKELMKDSAALIQYSEKSGREIQNIPYILDKVLEDYTESDIDILLIPGDLTKDGEKESHLELSTRLKQLIDKGIRIYVIPGNHDINMPNSVGFENGKTYSVENVSPEEFKDIYQYCGYNSAIKADTASLSYVTQLTENTWLLAIDGCLYRQYTTSSLSGGKINEHTEKWILGVLAEAKEKDIQVISMMHHGLVEHIPYQSMFFPQYLITDWKRITDLLADNGVQVIFTGHFHSNDITEYTSKNKNKIYDIETGALCSYPYPYRFAELSKDSLTITTKNITSIPQDTLLSEHGKSLMKSLSNSIAKQKSKGI
ncbi:MAG: metallophosphoesterase family protein [Dysgonomonas sp.]